VTVQHRDAPEGSVYNDYCTRLGRARWVGVLAARIDGVLMLASNRPPPDAAFKLIVNQLLRSTVELFAGYGLPVELTDDPALAPRGGEGSGLAIISYVGEGVRGSLTLLAHESAARAWMVAAGLVDGDPIDALGEFSNMLICRLKGELSREGFAIQIGTPTTVSGEGLRLSVSPSQSASFAFKGPNWQLRIRLDANFEDGFALPAFCDLQKAAAAGEAIEFEASSGW
jgi:CheY-specific phosphatase CheX